MSFIDQHKLKHGIEPICAVLTEAGVKIAPSVYYASKSRPPSARSISDAATTAVIDDLEIAVAEYIDWLNHRRLHGEIGLVPPAEHEETFYRHNVVATTVAASVPSLH